MTLGDDALARDGRDQVPIGGFHQFSQEAAGGARAATGDDQRSPRAREQRVRPPERLCGCGHGGGAGGGKARGLSSVSAPSRSRGIST